MAWRSTGSNSAELISNLRKYGMIESETIATAMAKVDRAHYVLDKDKAEAYVDAPQYIGYDATISAPHMHAHALQYLLPRIQPGGRVLDVGSGSGYLVAVLHHLTSDASNTTSKVVGIEHIPELVRFSVHNLRRDGLGPALDDGRIVIVESDGRKGWEKEGPYDAIHVGAAAPSIPQALIEQLASPGRMFIPIGTNKQSVLQVDKDEHGEITQTKLFDVMYVPLTDRKPTTAF